MKSKYLYYFLIYLELLGIANAGYLTYEHFAKTVPPCYVNLPFVNCENVLLSPYAVIFGIPISIFGMVYLITLLFITIMAMKNTRKIWNQLIIVFDTLGAIASLILMYLQIFVIRSLCIYCTLSALICFLLFFLSLKIGK